MELEMYLNGRFIDSIPVSSSQLGKIHELQHHLERKYCHELEYADEMTLARSLQNRLLRAWMNMIETN